MDYAAWKLFIDAAELGSLSKVALAYGTSQPHISRQIGELEQRVRRTAVPAHGPRRRADRARPARSRRRFAPGSPAPSSLANDVRTSAGTPIGKVRHRQPALDGASAGEHALYAQLKERYPLIQLAVREGQGAQLETWLEDGSVDLAILFRTSPTPKNGDTYLVETSTYLVSAAGDPLTSRPTVPLLGARTTCRSCCSAARTAGAIISISSAPSAASRSTSCSRPTRSACKRRSSPTAASIPCWDPMRSPPP